jgi:hypothetical protein
MNRKLARTSGVQRAITTVGQLSGDGVKSALWVQRGLPSRTLAVTKTAGVQFDHPQ